MPYVTEADYGQRYGADELEQVLRTQGGIEFSAAETDAVAIVNGYLHAMLPFTAVPARVKQLTLDITRYRLFGAAATEMIKERYQEAIEFLTAVAEGKLAIDGGSASPVDVIAYTAKDRVFTDETLALFG